MARTTAAPAKGGKATPKGSNLPAKQAPRSGGAVVPVDDAVMAVFAENAGAGLGNATTQDFALPFIYLLQKMSPAVEDVEGAEPGMFMNTVTQELFDELTVIPVEYEKVYNEWIPRDEGGGFVASHKTREDAENNRKDDDSTQIVDTANHYCLVKQADGTFTPAIISCTSTKLKASRQWLSRISQVMIDIPGKGKKQAPSFAKLYTVSSTGPLKNDKGTFYSIEIKPIEGADGWVNDPEVLNQALAFRASLQAGKKGADYSQVVEAQVVEAGDENPDY